MATTASPSTKSSDMPWLIGSGLVFIPATLWILSSGKGKDHSHPASNASKKHAEAAEAVEEASEEPTPETSTVEPTPEPVPEEQPAEATPEPSATESVVSDDDGVVISKEDLEESINQAIDADVPKEAKAAEPAPAPSEAEPAEDDQVAAAPPKEESAPPQAGSSTDKKDATGQ